MADVNSLPNDEIDDLGDFTLIVGPDPATQRRFLVSKVPLRLASPVWRAMFTGGFNEAQAQTKEATLPDDNPNALRLLLLLAHLKLKSVPNTLDFATLVEVAKICDKYDTVGLIRPYAGQWMAPHVANILDRGYEGWTWIAWTLGLEHQFYQVAEHMWNHTETSRLMALDTVSPGLQEELIIARRERVYMPITTECYALMDTLMASDICMFEEQKVNYLCTKHVMGALVMLFKRLSLPLCSPSPEETQDPDVSIARYSFWLQTFINEMGQGPHIYNGVFRCYHFVSKFKTLQKSLEGVKLEIDESYRHHIVEQGKK